MGVKVIVVDDSSTVRHEVQAVLGQAGHTVLEATDGVDALEKMRRMTDLSLVICDVNMPRMDGLAMLEAVKKDAALAKVPIVMLTTEGQPGLIRRARELGARAWIVKPFKPELLVAAVKKLTGG
jgi:two-component system chemotaxis response regulator CheY